MPQVSPIIKRATDIIPNSVYMRATDYNANVDIENVNVEDKVLVIYNNLPTVKNRLSDGGAYREYPVEVRILKLAQADDDDVDGDVIRAELLPYGDLVFDYCQQAQEVSSVKFADVYDLDFLDSVRIYDEVMTGLILKFTMYFDRKYFCIPEPEPIP